MTTDEQTLRAYFSTRNIEQVDITPRPDLNLGAAYVVKYPGGGGLALVRKGEVIHDVAAASVDRLIELDGAAQVMRIAPKNFVSLLLQWKAMPDLGATAIREESDPRVAPQWATIDGVPRFILHATRKSQATSRNTPVTPMRRAIGTLGPKGLTWELEDVDVPVKA